MAETQLTQQLVAYTSWRQGLVARIAEYRQWLNQQDMNDSQTEQRIAQLLARLNEDKLVVAFVAEFSRGKSELINAIFFAEYGRRILPCSAGRTTMCPIEVLYDENKPISIQLLPIETRVSDMTTSEYKNYADEWQVFPFDLDSGESMSQAFKRVSETKLVTAEIAESYGLYDTNNPDESLHVNSEGMVQVPCWRYAMINFPHPLLEQGLVILDTPGLNAVGTEPELTLNMLPNAHAVLFILSADTGVTKSESDVWRQYISGARWNQKGRLAVLNKIDGLWDELKDAEAIEAEINKQVDSTAQMLGLDAQHVYPVSAQKGLLAKVNGDELLLAKSRLVHLERALSDELIPSKVEIIRDNSQGEVLDLFNNAQVLLDSRFKSMAEQLDELKGLRGKNEDVVEHMMRKIKVDKHNFEKGVQRYQALRNIFGYHVNQLYAAIGMDTLRHQVRVTRDEMVAAKFTRGIQSAMGTFFGNIKQNMSKSERQIEEVKRMMDAMYEKFSQEHGLRAIKAPTFSMSRYQKEIAKLDRAYNEQFNTAMNMIVNEKLALTSKFFETLATRVIHVHELANRDLESWLKAVIAPMETQMREHQLQLRRRIDSIKRIYKATDTLEDRIKEMEAVQKEIQQQQVALAHQRDVMLQAFEMPAVEHAQAA